MNVLVIGDPHFQDSNIEEVRTLIDKIVLYAQKKKPDCIVVLGDILHTHEKISITPFKFATNFLHKLSEITKTFLIIGNHDYKNNSQFLTDNHGFNPLKKWDNMVVVDKVVYESFNVNDNLYKFCFLPYVPTGRFIEALNKSGFEWQFSDGIFAHQEFYGCKMGAITSVAGDIWDKSYPLVISGHIHDHQKLGDNCIYTGSILQHGYGDTSKKYLFLFTFEKDYLKGNKSSYKRIDLGMKEKKIVNINFDDLNKFKIDDYPNKIVKLDIKGTSEQFKTFKNSKKYKELLSNNVKVAFCPIYKDIAPSINQKELYKNKTYISIFRELCKDEDEYTKELCNEIISKANI